jgi:hypothetical protein
VAALLAGPAGADEEVGPDAVGDEGLGAVDDVGVAVAAGGGGEATSEPAPGSVIPSAPIFSPAIPGTSQRCFCSSVPKLKIGGIAIEVWAFRPAATPPEPPEWASSSTQTASWRWVPSWPP